MQDAFLWCHISKWCWQLSHFSSCPSYFTTITIRWLQEKQLDGRMKSQDLKIGRRLDGPFIIHASVLFFSWSHTYIWFDPYSTVDHCLHFYTRIIVPAATILFVSPYVSLWADRRLVAPFSHNARVLEQVSLPSKLSLRSFFPILVMDTINGTHGWRG